MRLPSRSMVVAGCISLATTNGAWSDEPNAQCQNKPNLTNGSAVMSNVFLMEGGQAGSVSDDVLMVDFTISVENAGGADAPESRIDYSAKVLSPGGQTVETVTGVANLDWTPAGGTATALVTVMASKLAGLVLPSGEIGGAVALRAVIDVDGQVDECDETDNEVETTVDLNVSADSAQS